jgi:hypothetical protein
MLWNQTKSKKSNHVSILFENIQIHTGRTFFERWVRACNEKNMAARSVVGDNFLQSQKKWRAAHDTERLRQWESRYASKDIFTISHSTLIYDNVTCYFTWKDGEIFGVEIYNQEIADSQRQLFELLWKSAQPLPAHNK